MIVLEVVSNGVALDDARDLSTDWLPSRTFCRCPHIWGPKMGLSSWNQAGGLTFHPIGCCGRWSWLVSYLGCLRTFDNATRFTHWAHDDVSCHQLGSHKFWKENLSVWQQHFWASPFCCCWCCFLAKREINRSWLWLTITNLINVKPLLARIT